MGVFLEDAGMLRPLRECIGMNRLSLEPSRADIEM